MSVRWDPGIAALALDPVGLGVDDARHPIHEDREGPEESAGEQTNNDVEALMERRGNSDQCADQ